MKIGNDNYFINTLKIATINKDLISSNFVITLKGENQQLFSLEKEVNIESLLASCKSFNFEDTINQDFLNQTYIDSISYSGIRANYLRFKINHINKLSAETVKGEFLIFYRTRKKERFITGVILIYSFSSLTLQNII